MPKLPKGMFKRGGSYYVRDRRSGRDRWVSLGADYGDAVLKMRQLRRNDMALPSRRVTVAEAARRWLATRISTGRNVKGQRLAESRVRLYLAPFMGPMPVYRIAPDDLREYRLWLEGRCRTPYTVAHILGDARSLFNWCEETGLIERSPVPRRLLPRLQERPPDRLTDDEVQRLVSLEEPYGLVLRLALGTGLRWGELCRAQASHVDNGMLVVSHTKTGKVRRVPLERALLREIRQRVGRLVPFSVKSCGAFNRQVRRRSGVESFKVKQTRSTFACRWLERGGSLAALQEILGHTTIVTTQRYGRLSDDMIRREAERLASC
jgi:integrase